MRGRRGRRTSAEGFTLIELMIVCAILAILLTYAVPKFASIIRKSNEGATKAHLGTLRSALQVYYSQVEGYYPSDLTPFQQPGNPYVSSMPPVYTYAHGTSNHVDYPAAYDNTLDGGGWGYVGTQNSSDSGRIWVECVHSDLDGTEWNTY